VLGTLAKNTETLPWGMIMICVDIQHDFIPKKSVFWEQRPIFINYDHLRMDVNTSKLNNFYVHSIGSVLAKAVRSQCESKPENKQWPPHCIIGSIE
jgi:hypothetical protein